MMYVPDFWIFVVAVVLCLAAVPVALGEGEKLTAIFGLIVAIGTASYIVRHDWQVDVVNQYEEACNNLNDARKYVADEKFSSIKANAYLESYIDDSTTWYSRIPERFKENNTK